MTAQTDPRHVLCVAMLALSAACASADVMSGNSEFGQGSVTIDTAQQLEFLDLTVTEGLSFNQVVGDQTYDGWRHASFAEVRQMWLNAGLQDWTGTEYSGSGILLDPELSAQVTALIDLVGGTVVRATFGPTQYLAAVGITSDIAGGGATRAGTELHTNPLTTNYGQIYFFDADVPSDAAGHWLVRQVPAPGSIGVLAVAGAVCVRRRR